MKIELNYTYDELMTLLDGLNNAIISLKRNYTALSLGVENGVPEQLLELKLPQEDYIQRFNAVRELYEHLETYENG
jgi:hypothetical protein